MINNFSERQKAQEDEYFFPYHYVPAEGNNGFSQTFSWSWGMHYLGGIQLVLSELKKHQFSSILDVGCGDGRFLKEVTSEFPEKRMLGIDYSETAILLAKALNPSISYSCLDITTHVFQEKFDIVTMIEVLEHIPENQVQAFLTGVANSLAKDGVLILTVPHVNKPLQDKHYQHFSTSTLREVLSPTFELKQTFPFDRISRSTSWMLKLLGYTSNQYIITNKKLNHILYKKVLHGCLKAQPESKCTRLLAVASLRY